MEKGHKVVVYTSDFGWNNLRLHVQDLDGVSVHFFRTINTHIARSSKFFASYETYKSLKHEMRNFDIVHCHEYRTFQNIVTYHYAMKYGVPYVLQAHGSLPRIMAKQGLKWIYDVLFGYRLLRDTSKVIALSRMEAEQYRGMGVPEEKIAVIHNGIDLPEYADLPPKGSFKKKFNIDEDERIVLYLGRIHRIKGIDILVKAFANIVEKLEDIKLVIIGPDDGYLGKLETLIEALEIENNVLIFNPLYGKDKLEAYVDADVYVLPSRYETFPMAVLEAVACGTPVILTENCGIAEYFRDKVGLVVKPDLNHVCDALLEMLLDQGRQNNFRENCNRVIERFDISETVSKLEEVYEKVADKL